MGAISKVINYSNISEGQTEFQRQDLWMMSVIRVPSGVYWMGQDLLNIRLKAFDPGIQDDPTMLENKIRGFVVKQAARPNQVSGTCSWTVADRVDQTISYFVDQWKLAAGDRDSLQGLAKEFYSADIEFIMYNVAETPIRKITLYNCMPPTGGLNEQGAEDPTLMPDLSISCEYEHFKREFLNRGA